METTDRVKKEIDWLKEAKNLQETPDFGELEWWKPSEGRYIVRILNNGVPYESEFGTGERARVLDKIRLEIETDNERWNWGITKGKTRKSLYGQLCTIAEKNEGRLEKTKITLLVKGKGKDKEYIILEAINDESEKEENSLKRLAKGLLSYIGLKGESHKNVKKEELYNTFDIPEDKIDDALDLLEKEDKISIELDGTIVVL